MFAFVIYKFAAFLAQRMSLPTARGLAAVVGRLTCLFQRRNRRHLYRNLRTALGDELSERELRRLRMDVFANFAVFVADFLWLPKIDRASLPELLTERSFADIRRLGDMAKGDSPVIFLTAHVGNWEMAGAAVALSGHPITALVDFHPSPLVTAFFDRRRQDRGVEVVSVAAFHRCFRALKEGRIIAIVGDRPVTGQGIFAEYFGEKTLVPDGHAVLARRLGATIVPSFLVMLKNGRYDFIVDEPIAPEITDDPEADIRNCVDKCLRIFERYIREYRDQWYAFRPIWGDLGLETDENRANWEDRLRVRGERRQQRLRAREGRRARADR
jgi:KDO2-lipid IV(A) lauroyltransferase